MAISRALFNRFFLAGLICLLVLPAGCETTGSSSEKAAKKPKDDKPDKQATLIRLHLEATPDATKYNRVVPVYRAQPVPVGVETQPHGKGVGKIVVEYALDTQGLAVAIGHLKTACVAELGLAADGIDRAAHSVSAIECPLGSPQDFNPLDIEKIEFLECAPAQIATWNIGAIPIEPDRGV